MQFFFHWVRGKLAAAAAWLPMGTKHSLASGLYAGRSGGLFSDSAACAPARRIGIDTWETEAWTKTVYCINPNSFVTLESNYPNTQSFRSKAFAAVRAVFRHLAVRSRRHNQRHCRKLRLRSLPRYHQS